MISQLQVCYKSDILPLTTLLTSHIRLLYLSLNIKFYTLVLNPVFETLKYGLKARADINYFGFKVSFRTFWVNLLLC